MTTIGDVLKWLDEMIQVGQSEEAVDLFRFFSSLPENLDLSSASYYLEKEFKRNDSGMDYRYSVEVFVDEGGTVADDDYWDSSGYDEWDDEEDEF